MKRTALSVIAMSATLLLSSCRGELAPMGGEPERQLVAATKAADIGKVNQFLASGANPNKMISFEGHRQSAWYQALWQLRPRRPELVEIVRVMLKAGASTKSAWGTSSSRPQESIWRSFLRPGRVGGSGEENPLHVAMMHPVPAVVRALIDAGLDPRQGESELASAVETGEVEIVHMLVEAGVDVNNHRGANTPLLAAIEARNVALMTYLEEHGAREKP